MVKSFQQELTLLGSQLMLTCCQKLKQEGRVPSFPHTFAAGILSELTLQFQEPFLDLNVNPKDMCTFQNPLTATEELPRNLQLK